MKAKGFVSKAQVAACYAQSAADKKAGKTPSWDCAHTASNTANMKALPKHVPKKKTYS
jgi:hypothetical protein